MKKVSITILTAVLLAVNASADIKPVAASQSPSLIRTKAEATISKRDIYLFALGQIESAGNDFAKGRRGEVGRYQCLKKVWHEATSAPTSMATNEPLSARVVLCVIWNRTGKDLNDISPKEFAKAWHCPNARRLNAEQKDYIKRLSNVVKSKSK